MKTIEDKEWFDKTMKMSIEDYFENDQVSIEFCYAKIEKEKKFLSDLVDILDAYKGNKTLISNQGQAMDGYSALANFVYIAE